jgi:MFS family permease
MTPARIRQRGFYPVGFAAYPWLVVAMLWMVCFFNYADRQTIYSVFPPLKAEMNLSDVQLGTFGTAFSWVYALAAPFAGLAGDRFSRKSLIIGGLVFWSVITAATALSTNYWELVTCRALEGLSEALYFPASMSLISDYHTGATRSRAMSLHQSSVYAGTIAGGAAAGFLGQYHGWRSAFWVFGALGLALGLLLLFTLREPVRGGLEVSDERPDAGRAGGVFNRGMAAVLIAVFLGANFVAMIFLTWMPSFLYRKFGMSLSMAGLSGTAVIQTASILGVLTGGVLADRLTRRHPAGRMLVQAAGLLLGVPFLFLTGWTLSIPVLMFAMGGFGFFKGMYDANLWAALHDVVEVRRRAFAVGIMNSIGWLGGGIAPVVIAGMSATYGMSACISATAGIYLSTGVLMLFGIRRYLSRPVSSNP